MKTSCSILLIAALASCGGGSSPPTTPVEPDPDPVTRTTPDAGAPDQPDVPIAPDAAPTPDPAQVKADLLAAETAAYEAAKPVLTKYCASCHDKAGKSASSKKLGHFNMTTYPFGGHHAGEMAATMREVLGIDGSKPTMPKNKPGAVKGDELALIAAWADAFEASHEGGAHEGMPGHEGHGDKH
jgi:hypothetical protein